MFESVWLIYETVWKGGTDSGDGVFFKFTISEIEGLEMREERCLKEKIGKEEPSIWCETDIAFEDKGL